MNGRYFSMFTGVGGFELGLENTGSSTNLSKGWKENSRSSQNLQCKRDKPSNETISFNPVGFSEIDKYANELLTKRFPRVKNYGDCTKINPSELPDFDMLCGGFPCQAFSIAGKRRGFEDTRGTMFFEIARILKVKRPKIVLLENVKGLLNHEGGKTFRTIIQTLSELGYNVQWMVLNSKFFGVPQNRERVFIIGSLRGTSRPEILPFRESDGIPAKELQVLRNSSYDTDRLYGTEGIARTMRANAGGKGAKTGIYAVLTPDRAEKRQNGRRFKGPGEPSFTMTGQDIHGVTDGTQIRRLTPTECERLQGFPDGWTEGFSDTQRYKMMGNAVTVNVIKALGEKLI